MRANAAAKRHRPLGPLHLLFQYHRCQIGQKPPLFLVFALRSARFLQPFSSDWLKERVYDNQKPAKEVTNTCLAC